MKGLLLIEYQFFLRKRKYLTVLLFWAGCLALRLLHFGANTSNSFGFWMNIYIINGFFVELSLSKNIQSLLPILAEKRVLTLYLELMFWNLVGFVGIMLADYPESIELWRYMIIFALECALVPKVLTQNKTHIAYIEHIFLVIIITIITFMIFGSFHVGFNQLIIFVLLMSILTFISSVRVLKQADL